MDFKIDKYNRKVFHFKTNHVMVNTLRRIIFQNIPNFAFDPALLSFRKNTSIYNNDQMRLRMSVIPVLGLSNDEKCFNEFVENHYQYVINNEAEENIPILKNKDDDEEAAIFKNEHSDTKIEIDNLVLTLVCSVKHTNNSVDYLNVTTDECKFYINNKEIINPYKTPLLLTKLRYNEEIDFSATSRMSIGIESPIWNVSGNCYFIENKIDEDYDFILENRGQLSEEDILLRAKYILIEKLKNIKSTIKGKTMENEGKLTIENDKFTIPALLNFYLQDHPDIEYSGYRCDHLLNDTSSIYFKTKNAGIVKILEETCDKIEKIVNKLII